MNILLITDDQHHHDFYEFLGRVPVRTPNLDRLRAEGTYFPNAFSNTPVCMPTRFTWLHGLYAGQAGGRLLDNHHNWPLTYPTLAQRLQAAGYETALVGKLHSHAGLIHRDLTVERENTRARGFDHVTEVAGRSLSLWYDCDWTHYLQSIGKLEAYRTELRTWSEDPDHASHIGVSSLKREETIDAFTYRSALDYLSNRDREKPFFLHLSFCSPHVPIFVPSDNAHAYQAADMPPDFPVAGLPPEQQKVQQQIVAAYATLVTEIDDYIGGVLALLQQRGELDQTLIVFTTDHGDMLGEHDRFGKQTWQEASINTPVLMWHPGSIPAGSQCDDLVEAVDLPLTLLEAATSNSDPAAAFPGSPGRSYWQAAMGRTHTPRDDVFSECFTAPDRAWRMIRSARWKYVYTAEKGETLIDLQTDPTESHNLAADPKHAATLEEFRLRMIARLGQIHTPNTDGGPFPRDPWFEHSLIHPSMQDH